MIAMRKPPARRRLKGDDRARATKFAVEHYRQRASLDTIAAALETAEIVAQPDGTFTGVQVSRNLVRVLLEDAGVQIRPRGFTEAARDARWSQKRGSEGRQGGQQGGAA